MKKIILSLVFSCSIAHLIAQYIPADWISVKTREFAARGYFYFTQRALEDHLASADIESLKQQVAEADKDISEVAKRKEKKIHTGYFLRYRAWHYFSAGDVLASIPFFIFNKDVAENCRQFYEKGFSLLHESQNFSKDDYTELFGQHNDSIHAISIQVDTLYRSYQLALIYQNTNREEMAMDRYIGTLRTNYNLQPVTGQLDSNTIYRMAENIITLGIKQKPYPQKLVTFCLDVFDEKNNPLYSSRHLGVTDKYILRLINNVFDSLIYQSALNKKQYVLKTLFNNSNPRFLSLYDKLDDAGLMNTEVLTAKNGGVQGSFMQRLIHYAAKYYEEAATDSIEKQAAFNLLKKHFSKMAIVAQYFYNSNNSFECSEVNWIASRTPLYPMDAEPLNYITKRAAECKKKGY